MAVYRFGDYTLDTSSGELLRGGYRVRLRPQPAALLEYLVQRPGEVVSRDELRRVLWPEGTFVHFDHGLNSCIKQLRAALMDDRVMPRFLETLPRRGYRFIGDQPADLSGSGSSEGWTVVAASGPADEFRVSGTVHRHHGRLRVSLRLVDAAGAQVWTTEFECDAGDPRSFQAAAQSFVLSASI